MAYYLYILCSENSRRLYVGVTDNLQRRLAQHNAGRSRSTKAWRPWRLVHFEAHEDLRSARKREWFLKHTPGGGKEKQRLAASSGMARMP